MTNLQVKYKMFGYFTPLSILLYSIGLPHVHSSWCLLFSTLILALTAFTTSALRSVVRYSLSPTLPVHCLLDLLCGLELCVCGFELGVILDIYAIPLYSVFLWIVLCWQVSSKGSIQFPKF